MKFLNSIFLLPLTVLFLSLVSCDSSSDSSSAEVKLTRDTDLPAVYLLTVTENTSGQGRTVGQKLFSVVKVGSLSFQGVEYSYTKISETNERTEYSYSGGDLAVNAEGNFVLNFDSNTWSVVETSGKIYSGSFVDTEIGEEDHDH